MNGGREERKKSAKAGDFEGGLGLELRGETGEYSRSASYEWLTKGSEYPSLTLRRRIRAT